MRNNPMWLLVAVTVLLLAIRWLFVRVRRGNIHFYIVRQSERRPSSLIGANELTSEERAELAAEQDKLTPLDGRD